MTAPVSQVLSEAADLLEKPGAWTQSEYARNAYGKPVKWRREAACFCAIGAIDAVRRCNEIGIEVDSEAIRMVAFAATGDRDASLSEWNDNPIRQQPEVVDALRRAAALAKEQGR